MSAPSFDFLTAQSVTAKKASLKADAERDLSASSSSNASSSSSSSDDDDDAGSGASSESEDKKPESGSVCVFRNRTVKRSVIPPYGI